MVELLDAPADRTLVIEVGCRLGVPLLGLMEGSMLVVGSNDGSKDGSSDGVSVGVNAFG